MMLPQKFYTISSISIIITIRRVAFTKSCNEMYKQAHKNIAEEINNRHMHSNLSWRPGGISYMFLAAQNVTLPIT